MVDHTRNTQNCDIQSNECNDNFEHVETQGENVTRSVVNIVSDNEYTNTSSHSTQIDIVTDVLDDNNLQKQVKEFRFLLWNIRGIYDKLFEPDLFNSLFTGNDIIILTESHTTLSSDNDYDVIPNYRFVNFPRKFIHPRAPGPSGGISVFVKTELYDNIIFESTHECIVWVKLKSSSFDKDIIIGIVYFPPEDSSYIHSTNTRTDYFNILQEELCKQSENSNIFLCGDFNARTGILPDYQQSFPGNDGNLATLDCCELDCTNMIACNEIPLNVLDNRVSQDKGLNGYGRQLLQICKSLGFRIMNGRLDNKENTKSFTCIKENGASVVDYIICQPESSCLIKDMVILPKRVVSDHTPINFSINVQYKENDASLNDDLIEGETISSYKWDSLKLNEYINNLTSENTQITLYETLLIDMVDKNKNSDDICKVFYDYLDVALSKTFKKKNSFNKSVFPNNKWFNEECKIIKRSVNDFARNYDITIAPYNHEYRQLELEYNRITQRSKRQYKDHIRQKLEDIQYKNPSQYWKFWKSLNKSKNNNSTLRINDFISYFNSQVKPPSVEFFDHSHMTEIIDFVQKYLNEEDDIVYDELSDDIINGPITEDEINMHLHKLKNGKAAGIDGISGEFLKYAPDQLMPLLYPLYNNIFENSDWPNIWADGIINPIHKKSSINVADNYRKVTVMPAAGKVLESILNSRLVNRNIILNLDDPYQSGFKINARTTDNIFTLNSIIHRQKLKGKPLYVCFVDFTKAFDYVNRAALYYKLIQRGIRGKLLKIIIDMYDKAKCKVKWKGKVGGKIDSEFGVLQGGMMSPKLFTEFLHDLREYFEKEYGIVLDDDVLTYILFADDLILMSETPEGLQKLLDGLFGFCKKWHLIVSLTKTNVMIFGKRERSCQNMKFKFNEQEIAIVSEYKYLGTIFSSRTHDPLKKTHEYLLQKASNAIFSLNNHAKHSVGQLQPILAFKMFDTLIGPILQYASDIWFTGKEIKEFETLQLSYIKRNLRVKTSSSTLAIYSDTGRFPVYLKQQVQALKYWYRVMSLDNEHMVKKAYNSLYESHCLGQNNWCSHIKALLYDHNHQSNWDNQIINIQDVNVIKEKIYKKFMDNCLNQINNSDDNPKLRTFKLFKTEFKLENYLTKIKNLNHSLALARFRISSHNLRIETGRYDQPKTPPENRICNYCDTRSVESEIHFILDCPLYTDERLELKRTIREEIPWEDLIALSNEDYFICIMSSENDKVMRALAKYVYICLLKRANTNRNV